MEKTLRNYVWIWRICFLCLGFSSCSNGNDYLKKAEEATTPNFNFLFASNASLPGRDYMTFSGKDFLPCINTVTSFFNKYHTCSNCEDFEKSPEKWNFVQVQEPRVGDIAIQHNSQTGRAYHAVIIVDIKNGKLYVNHALKKKYIKHAELKSKGNLTFYRYTR